MNYTGMGDALLNSLTPPTLIPNAASGGRPQRSFRKSFGTIKVNKDRKKDILAVASEVQASRKSHVTGDASLFAEVIREYTGPCA